MNLPNKLTVLRVFMIPFFVFFMLFDLGMPEAQKYIAAAIFITASFTDFLDGYLARKYNLVTNFGKFMDPLADKLLVCAALICLTKTQTVLSLSAWLVILILIISREFIISGFRLVASDSGVVIAASYWGKFKTVSQMIMIVLLIVDFSSPVFNILEVVFVYLAVILTIVSLLDYLIKNRNVLADGGKK